MKTMRAVHTVYIRDPGAPGRSRRVKPGELFSIDDVQAAVLVATGAAVVVVQAPAPAPAPEAVPAPAPEAVPTPAPEAVPTPAPEAVPTPAPEPTKGRRRQAAVAPRDAEDLI